MVLPGSHKRYVSCAGHTPDEHYKQSLRRQEYGVPEPEVLDQLSREGGLTAPKGKAGSALFFDCNLMHGSNSNITPFPRSNIFLVYNSVENALVEPFGGIKPRPEFVASREFTVVEPEEPSYPLLLKGNLQ
jgi:ectoine hydroxylase